MRCGFGTALGAATRPGQHPGSRLARQGLRQGDIITGSNRMKIRDLGAFKDVIQSIGGPLFLQVRRDGGDYVARVD